MGRLRTNFGVLSPNVQRIIQHSDAEPVEAVNLEALKHTAQPNLHSSPAQSTVHRKCTALQNASHHKPKPFNIHLSKIAGKLTQAGNDIVETFDPGSIDYPKPLKTPAISCMPSVLDDDKTPTNKTHPIFNFDNLQRSHKLSLTNKRNSAEHSNAFSVNSSSTSLSFPFTSPENAFEAIEHELKNLTLDLEEEVSRGAKLKELNETINKPLISKTLVRQKVELFGNSSNLPKLSAQTALVRSESLAASSTAKDLEEHDVKNLSSKSFALPTTIINTKQSQAQQLAKDTVKATSNSTLVSGETAKLKHRPLSSLSICSTSSSSSSGSGMDHISGKMNTSYLASVESLADPSENEQRDPYVGMTVFERACLEIVESERNYVNDLEEIIRGYVGFENQSI